MSLAQARVKANALNVKLESKESLKEIPLLLKDVYNEWIQSNAQKDRGLYLHIISKYGEKKLKELSKQDVLVCLDKLYKEGKRESIKRVFGRLSKLLKYAISREYIQTSAILNIDILSIYGKVQSTPFKAITDLKTFKELLCAIEAYQGSIFVLYALKISAHIFLRDSTIRNLKWEYIDFQNKQINIPASIIKGKEAFIVPLSKQVLGLFKELKQYSEVIELCLDHRERNKVKAAYNRSKRLEDRRELMQWWSDFIDALLSTD